MANVDADRASLTRVEGQRLRGTGARFGGAVLRDVRFVDCRLDLASFRFAQLERVRFEGCRLEEADFYEAGLTSVAFVDCSLTGASVAGASFVRCELRACDLTGLGNPERLRGVAMPWPDVVAAAAVLAEAAGVQILEG